MKKKQKEELRVKTIEELQTEIDKLEKEILKLNIDIQTGKIKNTSLITRKKDDLAIVKTILNEKILLKQVQQRSKK